MGYGDEPGSSGPEAPVGQSPAIWFQAIWFQQVTEPRPQRNRIHFDVSVPHDEAHRRIQAALETGGVLVSDASAPAFWVLCWPTPRRMMLKDPHSPIRHVRPVATL